VSRQLAWERQARQEIREISRLDARLAQRINAAIEAYADRDQGDVRKLAGSEMYRLRVGDWRILFTLDDGGRLMAILRIMNRRDAYR